MKLKNILGACIAVVATMLLGAVVYAAPSFELGTPIDLSTGESINEFEAGTNIAIPIDLYTDSNEDEISNFGLALIYDGNYIAPYGANATQINGLATGAVGATNSGFTARAYYAANCIADDFGPYGTFYYSKTESTNVVGIMATGINAPLSASANGNRVGYFIFTIVNDVPDDVLNAELFKINPASDATAIKLASEAGMLDLNGEFTTANACDGAFQVVYDTSKLTGLSTDDAEGNGYYVQKVEALIDGTRYPLEAYNNEDGATVYKFPVRLTSAADEASVDVEIIATVTDDPKGLTNSREMSWGTVNVDMSGTVSSYAENEANALN